MKYSLSTSKRRLLQLKILFDQGFGNIFVVRNVGNIVIPAGT